MGCSGSQDVGEKPRIVFFIGDPQCGKGAQCKRIVSHFKYQYFSPAGLLIQYVNDKKDNYKEIENLMNEGQIIPSSTVMKVLKEYIINSRNKKILIDGYPKKQENIDLWEKEMKNLVEVKGVLYIEISNEEIKKRLERLFRIDEKVKRVDYDKEELIKKRLDIFEKEIKPIVDYFEKQGNLMKIDGMKTEDEIFKEIGDIFKAKGLN